ncbi:MAG: hypothetical protein CSA39_03190 [Flavobacteriales bacterium]|nr:MAG: hypothetical protein CR985_02990 [Flavobacteriales bacterium]PIE49329.1 MAG: hypothetical protein CSA39_03190 [Flavobacteriales bacterium]
MATYKKRGSKSKKDKLAGIEKKSTTAEVFNTLDETASKSEQWVERNSKIIYTGLGIVALLILGYLAYNNFIKEPKEREAANELAYPRAYYDQAQMGISAADSLYNLALNGADGKYGLADIADTYGNTNAGNLAKYMAGIAHYNLSEYDEAIEYLNDFNTDDEVLGAMAKGTIGDAFAQLNQPEEALEYYLKAAQHEENDFSTPLFLQKAGQTAMQLKDYAKAEELFGKIKNQYPNSAEGQNIDMYLNRAKFLAQD